MYELIKENLTSRAKIDQEMRNRVIKEGIDAWDSSIDQKNTVYMQEVIHKIGWPKISDVGQEAVRAAWLLVQHADHKPDFQAQCLELMKVLPEEEIVSRDIAYLEDRVRVGRGEPQLYGTQFTQINDVIKVRPMEDPENLEDRRAKVGLEPFADNFQRMVDTYSQK